MKSGKTIAYEFIGLMRKHIERNFFYINNLEIIESFVEGKLKQEYFEVLLNEPIILYARKGSLKESSTSSDLKEHIDKIINYNNIHVLIALNTLSPAILKKLNVKWIIIEDDGSSKKILPYSLGLLLNMIHTDDQAAGKPSYVFLEHFAADTLSYEYEGFKKGSDAFFLNLYDIKTISVYETSEFKYINIYERKIPEEQKNKIFKYSCPICEKEFKISLNSGKSEKYKKLEELLIVEQDGNKKMLNFNCEHSGTNYYEKYKKFGLNLDKYKDLHVKTKEDKDIIFLYMFNSFKSDDDNIKFCINEKKIQTIGKDKFLLENDKVKDEEYEYEDDLDEDEYE